MALQDDLDNAEAEVARLKREIMTQRCGNRECNWVFIGCAACSCPEAGMNCCSIPVHECTTCKDSDYGENAEGRKIREDCNCERADA